PRARYTANVDLLPAQMRGHVAGDNVEAVERQKFGFEFAAKNSRAGIARAGDGPAPQWPVNVDRAARDYLGARSDRPDDDHVAFEMHDALAGADGFIQQQGIWQWRGRGGGGVAGAKRWSRSGRRVRQ